MKVILSRKGFDSSYGGIPSPIFPDHSMLSLPIPSKNDSYKYTNLFFRGKSFYEIIKELKQNSKININDTCHYDPMISNNFSEIINDFCPLFGQKDQSQTHLQNQGVSEGDIFLFFGWFKEVYILNGKYIYKNNAPDIHVIFGCLKIKSINYYPFKKEFSIHPHYYYPKDMAPNNCIFEGDVSKTGNFKYSNELILTKSGFTRSIWDLPKFFRNVNISYHSKASFKDGYFESAKKGQEFVIDANEEVINWANKLIDKHLIKSN